jgi:hypothetical protein
MTGGAESTSGAESASASTPALEVADGDRRQFFERVDWLAFGLTVTIVLTVYLFTLAPEVTLESSGALATGAAYDGVNCPPGLPLWTLYAWLFTKLLPFSNIAWRVGVSSAVAGALTCGMVALIVSRGGAMILEGMSDLGRLRLEEENRLRIIAGLVAGTAIGFHGCFWGLAVIVEPSAFTVLLFVTTLCFLFRWIYTPAQSRWLYAAFLTFGLTLSSELWLAVAIPGLPILVLFQRPSLGRDLFFALAVGFGAVLVAAARGLFPQILGSVIRPLPLYYLYLFLAVFSALICLVIAMITRRLLTHFGKLCICGALFFAGLSFYLYLPIASMTNPPVNWGYPRSLEGFFHALSRGQFEKLNPISVIRDPGRTIEISLLYVKITIHDFGIINVLPAFIPFFFSHRMRLRERGWLLGLAATYFCLSFFLAMMLNSSLDRAAAEMAQIFYPPSHMLLAIWEGYGLCLLGTILARKRSDV